MKKNQFNSLNFKLITLMCLGIVPIILGLYFYAIPVFEKSLISEKKSEVKASVDLGLGVLAALQNEVESGKIDEASAKEKAKNFFASMRYNETDYLFAYNSEGVCLAHGLNAKQIGVDKSKSKDADGKHYFQEFIAIAKSGGDGYVEYKHERKPGDVVPKISYLKFYPKWGWLVGSGVYVDTIQAKMDDINKKIYLGVGIIVCLAIVAALKYSMNLTSKLTKISLSLDTEADNISEIANSITRASEVLSSSTSQMASALQETSASVEETSIMIAKNADNAKASTVISEKSQLSIEEGKEIISEMIKAITEISKSNQNIIRQIDESNKDFSKIVNVISEIGTKTNVINDIVFQTKLLSFNASVEAARAGEQGKGFAVVAEEVGKLAQMSGNSAKEITDMLAESIRNVEGTINGSKSKIHNLVTEGELKVSQGVEIANRCGRIFDLIVNNMNQVNGMVGEIASASAEQATGISEINTAVTELDSVGQQNSTMSQQTSEFAEKLKSQVSSLRTMTSTLNGTIKGDAA